MERYLRRDRVVDYSKQRKEMRRFGAVILAAMLTLATAGVALGHNHGNGAGASGQCTGPQVDRPASCQSQGGPGDRP